VTVLALDLGATRLRAAVVLPDGTVVGRRIVDTPRLAAEVVSEAAAQLREALASADLESRHAARPRILAISAPGPLDPRRGEFLDPPNLDRSLWRFPFAARLSEAVGLPAVMERDTQVAALGEGEFGAARGLSDYVYLTVSTGVGGAIVSNGRLLRGPDGLAGELGHLTVDMDGPMCGCGALGHLEALASGSAIARAAREAGMGEIEADLVAAYEETGDSTAREIMQRARRAFAAAAVSIVDIFNPQRLVVGGAVAAGQGERLLQPAREAVSQFAFRGQAGRVEIVAAALGDDVSLVGGLALARLAGLGDDGYLHNDAP
jgi:glucokinase